MKLEKKIKNLCPDIDRHGLDIRCDYDQGQDAWQVRLKKNRFVWNTLLEPAEVEQLLSGRLPLSLSVELQVALDAIAALGR